MSESYLRFNGSSQNVEIAHNAVFNFGTDDFSISFWIKPTADNGVVMEKVDADNDVFDIKIVSCCFVFDLYSVLPSYEWVFGSSPVIRNKWTHVAIKKTAAYVFFYINGRPSTSTPSIQEGAPDFVNTESLFLNSRNLSNPLGCDMDRIAIYNKGLTDAEVFIEYNSGRGKALTGSEDGLIWGSNCDDATGDVLTDITGTVNGALAGNVADNMWVPGGIPLELESHALIEPSVFERWVW